MRRFWCWRLAVNARHREVLRTLRAGLDPEVWPDEYAEITAELIGATGTQVRILRHLTRPPDPVRVSTTR